MDALRCIDSRMTDVHICRIYGAASWDGPAGSVMGALRFIAEARAQLLSGPILEAFVSHFPASLTGCHLLS